VEIAPVYIILTEKVEKNRENREVSKGKSGFSEMELPLPGGKRQ